jgi:hypothetical protein
VVVVPGHREPEPARVTVARCRVIRGHCCLLCSIDDT